MSSQEGPPLSHLCHDNWTWDRNAKSRTVKLRGKNSRTVHFHPVQSYGASGVRGTRRLNQGQYYWEINVSNRIFGTSMMFGIGTDKARLHTSEFVNMLGEDDQGWGLSHKGLLWHKGQSKRFVEPFRENKATTIGLFFDGVKGTLEYYKDGRRLGVAFMDLHLVKDSLYPILCSTAAMSEMTLTLAKREFGNLQDRCRDVVAKHLRAPEDVSRLTLPRALREYVAEVPVVGEPRREDQEGKPGKAGSGRARCSFSSPPHARLPLANHSVLRNSRDKGNLKQG